MTPEPETNEAYLLRKIKQIGDGYFPGREGLETDEGAAKLKAAADKLLWWADGKIRITPTEVIEIAYLINATLAASANWQAIVHELQEIARHAEAKVEGEQS